MTTVRGHLRTSCSVHGSARDDPLRGLAGDLGDDVEVAVVVKNDQAGCGRGGGNQEVGDSRRAVLAGLDKATLDRPGNLFGPYRHDNRNESIEKGQHCIVICHRPRRVANFEIGHDAAADLASVDPGHKGVGYGRLADPRERRLVDQPAEAHNASVPGGAHHVGI
jgi:hypothetical protein